MEPNLVRLSTCGILRSQVDYTVHLDVFDFDKLKLIAQHNGNRGLDVMNKV